MAVPDLACACYMWPTRDCLWWLSGLILIPIGPAIAQVVASARGGSPLRKRCSWKLAAAWLFSVAVLVSSTALVAWFLLLQARLAQGLGTHPVEKRGACPSSLSHASCRKACGAC